MINETDTIPLDTSELIISRCKNASEVITYCLDAGYPLKKACKLAYKHYQIDHKEYLDGRYVYRHVKTFEHVCYILNIEPNSILIDELTEGEIAGRKLKLIIKVLNNGWVKDWNNSSEYHYTPYFDMRDGSFSYFNYYSWHGTSHSVVGLGFKSKELLEHAVKYWLEEYRIYFKGE
jgi:hypothetical protein